MKIIVMKFGGTSVANVSKLKNVAKIVKANYKKNKLIVVLSAMAGETNKLQSYIDEIGYSPSKETDLVITSGEQVTVGLLSMILNKMNIKAMPLLGWQVPILTDDHHEKAKILNINNNIINNFLKKNDVLVLAGFQGISTKGNITSFGRGGSDTTAVAIASSLKAERCDIYTDVEGIYTTDPNKENKAKKLKKISYEEMLEMSSMGAKVLNKRSVELAMKNNLRLQVLSSLKKSDGTFIVNSGMTNSKVGIGTTIPNHTLSVSGTVSASSTTYLGSDLFISRDLWVDNNLVVTGNTVMNGTLSATTSCKIGNGDGSVSAATINGVTINGTTIEGTIDGGTF